MRRWLVVVLLSGVVASAAPAHAAPSPQVTDPKGDWQVASQDVLSARLSSRYVGGKPSLRGELRLAAVPDVPTTYRFNFGLGCSSYSFAYVWPGVAQGASATFERWDYCAPPAAVPEAPKTTADATFPVTFAVTGTTLVWQAAYAGGIKKGVRVANFAALACTVLGGVVAGDTTTGSHEVWAGDIAYSANRYYVVGSDLPRR